MSDKETIMSYTNHNNLPMKRDRFDLVPSNGTIEEMRTLPSAWPFGKTVQRYHLDGTTRIVEAETKLTDALCGFMAAVARLNQTVIDSEHRDTVARAKGETELLNLELKNEDLRQKLVELRSRGQAQQTQSFGTILKTLGVPENSQEWRMLTELFTSRFPG